MDRHAVQGFDGSLRFFIGTHFDKAEALRAAGFAVGHDLGRDDGAVLGEVLLQAAIVDRVGQVTDEEFVVHMSSY